MEQERKKPSCPLVGQNGNIFNLTYQYTEEDVEKQWGELLI